MAKRSSVPWYITTFFKLVSPFIDPVTKTKMEFSPDMPAWVPKEQLPTDLGGDVALEYDHEVFWPALTALGESKRNEMKERWEKRGKKIGESEFYIRGGEDAQPATAEEPAKASEPAEPQP